MITISAWIEETEDGFDVRSDEISNEDGLIAQRDTYEEAEKRLEELRN